MPDLALLADLLGFTPALPLPLVHVVGDSHSLFFTGSTDLRPIRYRRVGLWRPRYITTGPQLLPCFRVFHLGAATAWNCFAYRTRTRTREKLEALLRRDLDKATPILLSFGEIDCRYHLPRQVLNGRAITEVVREAVERFFRLPLDLRERGYTAAVWGPPCVAPVNTTGPDDSFPVVGDITLRREICDAYCRQLHLTGRQQGIPCISLATANAGPPQLLDAVHLSPALLPLALRELQTAGVLQFGNRIASGHEAR